MLNNLEFVIILIVATFFLKPKDLIAIIAFTKELITKIKHILYLGKQELNNLLEETQIEELKKQVAQDLKKPQEKYTQATNKALKQVNDEIDDLKQATNLNLSMDNILKESQNIQQENKK